MEQFVLLTFTEYPNGRSVKMERNEGKSVLMKRVKAYLNEAAADLLQPRPEAVTRLLELARQ